MREIKFRAKHLRLLNANKNHDGEWIYGLLCGKGKYIEPENGFEKLIDINTIGQYTGLKDKNGKEIYEGDILRTAKGYIQMVLWVGYYSAFVAEIPSGDRPYLIDSSDEVIGNIHDNPELLDGDNE